MTEHTTHKIRETTALTYPEIQDMVNSDQEEVYNYIKLNEGQTSVEIINGMGYETSLKQIRPRITELFLKSLIIYGNKRPSVFSDYPSFEVYTKVAFEKKYLKVLGFREIENKLYVFYGKDYILYQDFRSSKGQARKSYAYDLKGNSINHQEIEIHQTFKKLLSVNKET